VIGIEAFIFQEIAMRIGSEFSDAI
jgi:hypothetical protein